MGGAPVGAIRISLGMASVADDVAHVVEMIREFSLLDCRDAIAIGREPVAVPRRRKASAA